jgi:hypothetical protein
MSEKPEETQITELISSKIAAEDATSEWVVAWAMMQALPVLKDIAALLKAINEGIAPLEAGRSIGAELRLILNALDRHLGQPEGKGQ